MSVPIQRFSSRDADFVVKLDKLRAFESAQNADTDRKVQEILAEVRECGDAALLEFTNRFDRWQHYSKTLNRCLVLADKLAIANPHRNRWASQCNVTEKHHVAWVAIDISGPSGKRIGNRHKTVGTWSQRRNGAFKV